MSTLRKAIVNVLLMPVFFGLAELNCGDGPIPSIEARIKQFDIDIHSLKYHERRKRVGIVRYLFGQRGDFVRHISFKVTLGNEDSWGDFRPIIVYVPEDMVEQVLSHYSSLQLRLLHLMIEREARKTGEGFSHWLWKLATRVSRLESEVLLEELTRENPGRSISVDGCGITIG